MATGKYGSASVIFLVGGYNLIANKLKGLRYKHEALQEETTGLGDSWAEHTPRGLCRLELAQQGAYFDTDLNRIHTAMSASVPSTPQASTRVVCLGFAGQTIGESFVGFEGAFSTEYEVLAELGGLTKANVAYVISGQIDHGVILQDLEAQDDDWISDTVVDNAASSADGGVGYLQVTLCFGTFTGAIEHSSDNSSWTTLMTFTAVTASPEAERKTVTGEVKRYLRFSGTVWGDVSASASTSPSSSVSPSVSESMSGSASTSPSSSLSPSVSASASWSSSMSASASTSPSSSTSPSTSLSPSSSLSPSVSASISASASISPSSSLSPSVSASASASPTAEAGVAGNATVFCGFKRS